MGNGSRNLGKTEQVDYTIAIYHHSGDIAATGSLDRNILKCLVVCKKISIRKSVHASRDGPSR